MEVGTKIRKGLGDGGYVQRERGWGKEKIRQKYASNLSGLPHLFNFCHPFHTSLTYFTFLTFVTLLSSGTPD